MFVLNSYDGHSVLSGNGGYNTEETIHAFNEKVG